MKKSVELCLESICEHLARYHLRGRLLTLGPPGIDPSFLHVSFVRFEPTLIESKMWIGEWPIAALYIEDESNSERC